MDRPAPTSTKHIQRLRAAIASWRRERYARAPLPAHLWAQAAEVARQVGINQARLALGVSHVALRAHAELRAEIEQGSGTQFVELSGAEVLGAGLAAASSATIEIHGRDVQVTVRLAAGMEVDMSALIMAVSGRA